MNSIETPSFESFESIEIVSRRFFKLHDSVYFDSNLRLEKVHGLLVSSRAVRRSYVAFDIAHEWLWLATHM